MIFKKRERAVRIDAVGGSNVGSVRRNNQDYYYTPKHGDKLKLAIVADGMGGYKGGDIASELCVNTIVRFINKKYNIT